MMAHELDPYVFGEYMFKITTTTTYPKSQWGGKSVVYPRQQTPLRELITQPETHL